MHAKRRTLAAAAVAVTGVLAATINAATPWPADVPGFVKPEPGEHPRLLFRRSDLTALRRKAGTPEGKAIIARLRHILGGNGETLPQKTSSATRGYPGPGKRDILLIDDMGYLTLGHPAGYGLLYQLTGDRRYADLGRQAFEVMMKGVRDVDSRYSLVRPNGELRSGSSWAVAALGYDLCYDGWDPEFRVKMATFLLSVQAEQGGVNLRKVVTNPKYGPHKNHFGGIICGALAAAALMNDPGTEAVPIEAEWMPKAFEQTRRMLTGGFGDHGFYSEGHGPSHVSSDTGLLAWLQAARIACGKDFITPAPNAQWITLRWVMEMVPTAKGCAYPDRKGSPASYGNDEFWRGGYWSHGSQFAQGFGAVDPKYHPAMLWVYRNVVEPAELQGRWPGYDRCVVDRGWLPKGEKSYDVLKSVWKGVMSFVSWPVGVEPENPVKVLGHSVEDRVHGYYVFRNRWQDENDIVVTALLGYGPKCSYKPQYGPIYLWAFGKRYAFGSFGSNKPADYASTPAGGVVSTGAQCLGVDFSGACGAPALLVLAGIDGPKPGGDLAVTTADAGAQKVTIVTVQAGRAPEVRSDGKTIAVGGRTVAWDGGRIRFGEQP